MNDHGWVANIAAAGTLAITLAGWLPPFAAAVALVWYFIQITESDTVRNFMKRRRARHVAKLKERLRELERQDT